MQRTTACGRRRPKGLLFLGRPTRSSSLGLRTAADHGEGGIAMKRAIRLALLFAASSDTAKTFA